MKIRPNPRAKLLVELPVARYRISSRKGRVPKIGDIVVLDQGFTGPDGMPMVVVQCRQQDGETLYEAEVYESELE